jgi:hypothetical protein
VRNILLPPLCRFVANGLHIILLFKESLKQVTAHQSYLRSKPVCTSGIEESHYLLTLSSQANAKMSTRNMRLVPTVRFCPIANGAVAVHARPDEKTKKSPIVWAIVWG